MKDENKRELILDAALSVVAAKGYSATKVDDIAHKAGVAKGTVYLHFKDKADIYIGLVDRTLSRGLELIRDVDALSLSPKDKLCEVSRVWGEKLQTEPSMMPFVSMEGINIAAREVERFKQTIKPRIRELIEALAIIIRPGIASGEFRGIDPYMGALMFLHCFPMCIMVSRHELPVQDPIDATLDMYLHGILPPKPDQQESL